MKTKESIQKGTNKKHKKKLHPIFKDDGVRETTDMDLLYMKHNTEDFMDIGYMPSKFEGGLMFILIIFLLIAFMPIIFMYTAIMGMYLLFRCLFGGDKEIR